MDKQEIHEVLMRYSRGVDRCDADLIDSAYHPDASDDHVIFSFSGRDAGKTLVEHMRKTSDISLHCLSNVSIRIAGDVAECESYFQNRHVSFDDDAEVTRDGLGRYIDRMERRNGEWRIARRVVLLEWSHIERSKRDLGARSDRRSFRSKADPSYGNRSTPVLESATLVRDTEAGSD